MENEEVELIDPEKKQKSVSKITAGISLGLMILTILLALLFDFLAFKDAILTFVAAIVLSAAAFVLFTIFFVVSFVLIFGFYLVNEHGFWPLSLSISFFKEVIGDIVITAEQVAQFRIYRIIIIVLCCASIALSIVSKVYYNKDKSAGLIKPFGATKGIYQTALVMAIIGIVVSIGMMIVSSFGIS